MNKQVLDIIKSRGYWRINCYPKVFLKDKISNLTQCHEILKKAIVELRGWDYPHFPTHNDTKQEIYNSNDCIESWINWGSFNEFWRMYQSGQFIHFFSMIEDWYKEDGFFVDRKHINQGTSFSVVHAIYRITEIFEFLKRLAKQKIYLEGVDLEIKICKTEGRKLILEDPLRIPLWDQYTSKILEIVISGTYSEQELIENSQELALKTILHVFEQFNWNNPPIETIKNDQKNLLERKF